MRKIIVVFLLLFPFFCSADFENFKWQSFKDVETPVTGLVRMAIDDEIFANTQKDLRDLRIISSTGEEVPYQLLVSRAKNTRTEFRPEILNNSYKPEEGSQAILDFGPNNQGISSLVLTTSAINFRRNVSVFGSDERTDSWSSISEGGYVYDYTDKRGDFKAQSMLVNFPKSIFRYLKIVVADEDNSPLRIDSVLGYREEFEPEKELLKNLGLAIVQQSDTSGNFTEAVLDLGQNGIAVKKIQLEVFDENFNRGVQIFSAKNPRDWLSVGQSYIFRYQTPKFKGENLELNFREVSDRYLKIRIANGDDKPLSLGKATTYSVFKQVAFKGSSDKKYKIYFGNPYARFPEYDLNKFFNFLDSENAPVLTLSPKKNNESYVSPDKWGQKAPEPKKEYKIDGIPFLMSGGLILVIFLLMLLVYRFFRK